MTGQMPTTEQQDVLTLHKGILRRWESTDAMAERHQTSGGALTGAERLMAGLPGLATLTGTFGTHAWELATSIASDPMMLQRFSLDARAMSVSDLADLIQLVLEEEEVAAETDEIAPSRPRAVAKSATAKSAKPSAPAQAKRRTAAPGMARKLKAVRKLVAELKSGQREVAPPPGQQAGRDPAMSADSSLGGASRPEPPGQMGSADPARGPTDAAVARPSTRPAAAAVRVDRWLDPLSTGVDLMNRAPRSLRMAQEAADFAFLAPTADEPFSPAAQQSMRPAAPRAASMFAATAGAADLPTSVASSTSGGPRAPASGTAQSAVSAAVASPARWAAAVARADAYRPVAAGLASSGPAVATRSASPLAALAPAVAFAARKLESLRRWDARSDRRPAQATAANVADAAAVDGAARGTATADLRTQSQSPPRLSGQRLAANEGSPDRFAQVMGTAAAPASRWGRLVPRLAAWLERSDTALTNAPTATAEPRRAYAASETGAGEWLVQGANEALSTSDAETTAAPVRSTTATATATRVPAWIAPQAARRAEVGRAESARVAAARNPASRMGAVAAGATESVAPLGTSSAASFASVSSDPASSDRPRSLGFAALAAAGLSRRLADRLIGGLDPQVETPFWQPRSAQAPAANGVDTASSMAAGAFNTVATNARAYSGELAAAAGAGDWLVSESEAAEGIVETAVAERRGAAPAARSAAATGRSEVQASRLQSGGSTGPRVGQTLRSAGAVLAHAAAAAIERVVQQSLRSDRLRSATAPTAAGRTQPGASAMDFAGIADTGLLASAPNGLRDVLTPWLATRAGAAPSTAVAGDRAAAAAGVGAEFVQLAPGDEAVGLDSSVESTSTPASGTRAASASMTRSAATDRTRTATRSTPAERRFAQLAAAVADAKEPAALRAALTLFGTQASAVAGTEVARAFLARWFGRPEAARTLAAAVAPSGAAEMVALRREMTADASPSSGSSAVAVGRAAEAKPASSDQIVLTGLAALAALGKPTAEREAAFHEAAGRQMRFGDVERELLAPSAESGLVDPSMAAADVPARGLGRSLSGKSTAVQLHEFVPVGLRRGRGLVSSHRRSGSLVRMSPRTSTSSRVGYGDSALGAGEMVGLGMSDATAFHGDVGPMPAALRGADRLGGIVQARRAMRGAGQSAPMPLPGTRGEGPGSVPSNFTYGQPTEFVNPAAAVQNAVAQQGRSSGATAAGRSTQASAMARVLSVTAAPSENMLPLVAPAAHAMVAAAAAKPLSESIITSGADATLGMPTMGQSSSKHGGGKGQEQGGKDEAGGPGAAQDLDALAMKIARSVMMRLKRERERRGIHG